MLSLRKVPRQGRSIAMVEAIIEASTRILVEDGCDRLTTNAVAERAGASIGSLYQYFPNRDAILVALIAKFETDMHARMQAAIDLTGAGFDAKLAVLVETALACHFEAPRLALILEQEEARLGQAAQSVLARPEAGMSRFVRAFVRSHARAGDEVDRIAHRMEIVGRALVDDALRRSDCGANVPAEIAATIRACAPARYWAE